MSIPELSGLKTVHVASVVTLIAYTFYGFAAAPETRKRVLMVTGIAGLLAVLTGIRMWQGEFGFSMGPGMRWVAVKGACWLGLMALAGVAYRRRAQAGALMAVALILAVVALVMVYVKPF